MKKFLLFYSLVFIQTCSLFAKEAKNNVINCLGVEEEKLHKEKDAGIFYRLNQDMLILYVNVSSIPIYKPYVEKICGNSPSIYLLFYTLFEREKLFDNELIGNDKQQKSRNDSIIKEYLLKAQDLFVNFLGILQLEFKDSHCYKKKYPIIADFLNKFKLLSAQELTKENIWNTKELKIVLNYFKNVKDVIKNCK